MNSRPVVKTKTHRRDFCVPLFADSTNAEVTGQGGFNK
jgi:hypothetical protein